MRNTIRTMLILAALIVSVGAFAQPGGYENPDPDPGGGSGGGGCQTCYPTSGNHVTCSTLYDDRSYCFANGQWNPQCTAASGYTTCVAHNAEVGPPFCEVSGNCMAYTYASSKGDVTGSRIEDQTAGIQTYLRRSGVISDADLNDFIAVTDYSLRGEPYAVASQKRLAAYREEFNRLVARGDPRRELKPGAIPVIPHTPTKAPATVTASR